MVSLAVVRIGGKGVNFWITDMYDVLYINIYIYIYIYKYIYIYIYM